MRLLPAAQHPFSSVEYAAAFPLQAERVDAWGVHLLRRPIAQSTEHDLAGCYPLTSLAGLDGDVLRAGLDEMAVNGAVSVAFVADPWGMPDMAVLEGVFGLVRPFKTHLAYDRAVGPINYTRRHWREVRQARSTLQFVTADPKQHVSTMATLYANLIEAKHIEGMAAFGPSAFESLAATPGLRLVLAYLEDEVVGCMTFIVAGDVCYAHLAGTTDAGRRHCAHYGCYAEALESFTDCRVIHLGGGPGVTDNPDDPIMYVKSKFSNVQIKSVLCGAVLDPLRYAALSSGGQDSDYFPAYRSPPPALSR